MASKHSITVAPFGQLYHVISDLWERPIELQVFSEVRTLRLRVDIAKKEGLRKSQIQAYEIFLKGQPALLRDAENGVFKYYQSICNRYRGKLGIIDPNDAKVPLINDVRELAKLVMPTDLVFPYAHTKPTFGLVCDCTWEPEHGVGAMFVNGKLVEVGFQDIVL